MFQTLFASISGFRIGDMLFAFFIFLAFILSITELIITFRRKSKREQLERIENKLDQVLKEKGR
ncbi:DUF4083 domain-containing protein [Gracilibacillus oryzae]|uniref:DUF4083 domain-containing protein n=1 Tax=Gracilibacillus oryzae TaxID=1672701 RepID=A0A7C8GR31_9BACI|nr:DUF4083 domain-containing protein [Gracilibacillus oryzae]KAB8127153.1 DUF4083 domain-containing protein [Gracilibacillus oryzae]